MLTLDNLVCGYGPFVAVHGLDLAVPAAGVVALVGANGAGKSSTIMAIAGHVAVQSGAIRVDGEDVTRLPARERLRRGVAVAPEGRRLFPDLTVAENLEVGGYVHPRARVARSRERVLALFPRLGERLGQQAGSLSGGEQQMLAIGRALMAEPRLLMIDEVSLGLMPKVIDQIYAAIAALRADGIAVLLVEQSTRRALEIADQVCVLESGRPVWRGSAAEARGSQALIDAYLGLRQEPLP
jgi:branched-chain amino acid transport system ATP-binding protein